MFGVCTKGMWETPQTYGRRYSAQMRLKLSFLAIKENAWRKPNTSHHPENTIPTVIMLWEWQHHAVRMFFNGRDLETGQNIRNDVWCYIQGYS